MKARTHFFEAQKIIFKKRGLVGALYLVNILFAIALTIPINANLEALATTTLADEMIDGFFFDHFPDYWQQFAPAYMASFRFILIFAGFYLLFNTFFTGGILAILAREPAFDFRKFLHASATYFGRNFRLFLISIPVLIIFAIAFAAGVVFPLTQLANTLDPDAANRVFIAAIAIAFLLLGLWNMLFDYAKIAIFSHDKDSAWKGFFAGAGFAFKNFPKAALLYFMNFGLACFFFVAYFMIESVFSNDTLLQTYILLLIQQVFILSRLWIKISFFASQQHFYTYVPEPDTKSIRELFISSKIG
ncbi:MAG: hypothetical protein ACE5I1_31785 [bacterium]